MKKRIVYSKASLVLFLMGLFIFLIFLNTFVFASTENSAADYATSYQGEWYSAGFSSFANWRSFSDALINSLLKFTIIEKDNKFGVMIVDSDGNGYRTPYLVNLNSATGEISGTLNYSLPNGDGKILSGGVLINGESNTSKFFNPKNYINKSIKDLILYGIANKLVVSFVGTKSKTTVSVHPNSTSEKPMVIINYEKFQKGDTSLIPADYDAESINDSALINNSIIASANLIASQINNGNQTAIKNESNTSATVNLSIINAKPTLREISIFVNETKRFSVENTNYGSLKWYVDEKEIKSNSKFYDFKALKPGFYTVNVEINKDSETKSLSWDVEVKVREIKEEKKELDMGFWILILVALLLVIGIVIYLLKRRTSIDKSANNSSDAEVYYQDN